MLCIIPARSGSSLKDKNVREFNGKPLLVACVEKCIRVFDAENVFVLTDSERYAALARGAEAVVPYVESKTPDREDVTEKLRRFVRATGFFGNLAVVQCTGPKLSEKTLHRLREIDEAGFPTNAVYITVVSVSEKATSFFIENENRATQIFDAFPPTAPRQQLPPLWHFTGGACLLHSSQLAEPKRSFFDGADVRLLKIPPAEALDIDTEQDFFQKS